MIQDSINQMLGTMTIGARLGSEAATAARNQKFAAAQSKFLDKSQQLQNEQNQALALVEAGKDFGRPRGGVDLAKYEEEQGNALEQARVEAEKASKRWFFPDKESMNKYSALQRQQSAMINDYEIKRMQAEQSWKNKAAEGADQAQKYKEFVEHVAEGYSRHGKGQQLYNQTEEARKLLKGGK